MSTSLPSSAVLDLSGSWRFRLDPRNCGLAESWQNDTLTDAVSLPGSLPGHGIGNPITEQTPWMGTIVDRSWFTAAHYEPYRRPGNIKVPFWLQPDTYYAGAAWYQRDILIPAGWRGRRIILSLERPHWQTQVWLDGRHLGTRDSLSVAHDYDLGADLSPGSHTLTIRVDNSLIVDVGINSHSISDHTQGNWNGIAGRMMLAASEPVWIDDLQVFPDAARKRITVRGTVLAARGHLLPSEVTLSVHGASALTENHPSSQSRARISPSGQFNEEISLGDRAQLWDEFSPALYRVNCALPNGESRSTTFGLRNITTQGIHCLLNGRPIYFRGTLDCCVFPRTGHPPTDHDSWRRILSTIKSHGLNLIRFHSWCPPEAAFTVADELGLYFHVEAASWANFSTTIGDGKPVDAWIYAESERIIKAYGNHPSFLLMTYGNEPGGDRQREYLAAWIRHFQSDPRRLLTSGAGWPEIPENHFHVTPHPRIYTWGEGQKSRINAQPPETLTDYREFIAARSVPVISHEIGQWCVYPNFAEMAKYTGYLKPKNFEIFQESLAAHHMLDQAHDFLIASGKLQTLCYKEEIESALRTPGMGGFELLGLNDFPGQGTALVGVLDPFWESKGYVSADEFRRFSGSVVPLARLAKRVFTTDESLSAELEVAHFGPHPLLPQNAAYWRLRADDGVIAAQGTLPPQEITPGRLASLGNIRVGLRACAAPARYKLIVGFRDTHYENDWDIWVYPATVDTTCPPDLTVTGKLDAATLSALQAGGRALLLVPPDQLRGDARGPVALGFSSIFWNTAWTDGQKPHTLGILCDPKHPALRDFPTDSHTNWQWWYLIHNAGAMVLDSLPAPTRPIVQVIDDWFTNRKLGLLVEARIGAGRLLICSIPLDGASDPVSRQMLSSLIRYAQSEAFNPSISITVDQIQSLLKA